MRLPPHVLLAVATLAFQSGTSARALPDSDALDRRSFPVTSLEGGKVTSEVNRRSLEKVRRAGPGGRTDHDQETTKKDPVAEDDSGDGDNGSPFPTKEEAASVPQIAGPMTFNNYPLPCNKGKGKNCGPDELPFWRNEDGSQKPYRKLEKEMQDGLWEEAGKNGTEWRKLMDDFVTKKSSRLDVNKSKVDKNFQDNYEEDKVLTELNALESNFENVNLPFENAGIKGIDGDEGFTLSYWNSFTPGKAGPGGKEIATLSIAANPTANALVSMYSYTKFDGTFLEKKKVGTASLTWNAWKRQSMGKAKELKYHLFHDVNNNEHDNLASLAHIKFEDNVDEIGANTDGDPFGPECGHGKWVPSDEAFNFLLNSPVIQVAVNLVIERNPKMANPTIAEIHTWPAMAQEDVPGATPQDVRKSSVLIVYGPKST